MTDTQQSPAERAGEVDDGVARCQHGKPVATKRDLDAYEKREFCRSQGDCRCPLCSRVCWETECAEPVR